MTPCDVTPWEHLRVSQTSMKESGRGVSFAPRAGERVSMFPADTKEFRAHFGNQQSCDAIFLVETSEKRTLVFIELKGRRFEDAVEQLAATLLAVRPKLPLDCAQSTALEAMVVSAGGTPSQEARKALELFQKKTRVRLRRKSLPPGKTLDLRENI